MYDDDLFEEEDAGPLTAADYLFIGGTVVAGFAAMILLALVLVGGLS